MARYPWTIAANLIANTVTYAFGDRGDAYASFFGPSGYRRPGDYAAEVARLVAASPEVARRVTLAPETVEGRVLEVVRVRRPGLPATAPRVLLTSLLHAREFITGETAMAVLEEVLEGTSEPARRLAERCELDVLPIVNPDGVALNLERMVGWRERFGPLHRGNARGVDLNRNFGHGYSNHERAYSWRMSDEFAGSGAFSEPESRALKALCEQRRYAAAINLHSYSNVLIYPRFGGPEVDAVAEEVALTLPALQPAVAYTPVQGARFFKEFPGARLLFEAVRGTEWVHGTFDDWLYAMGTHALLIEISSPGFLPEHLGEMAISQLRVFNPPPAERRATIDNVLPAIYGFFHGVLDRTHPLEPQR